ncbi:MAG: molecular chaperone [Alphaproteobacteria bacterium]
MNKPTSDQINQLSLASHFLGRLFFLAPSQEVWDELKEIKDMEWLFDDASEEELEYFEMLKNSLVMNLDEIAVDHAQLFTGPGDLKAAPWASIYVSEDKQVFGDETIAVREYYEKYQHKTPNPFREPEDHIGLEFQFIGMLLMHLNQALDNETYAYIMTDTQNFIAYHFIPWAPDCLMDVKNNAQTEFYQAIGGLAFLLMLRYKQILLPDEQQLN